MKKFLLIVMILGLILSSAPTGLQESAAASLFADVPDNAWYKKDLEYIANDSRKIMEGYNGKFFPGDTLTVEQFLKTVTVAAGFVAEPVQPPIRWSYPYIDEAYAMKLVQGGEFTDFERGITRAEMARIIIRALPHITGETKVSYDLDNIKSRMSDYNTIPENLRDYVCQAYQIGILTGGSDGKFNPNKTLVRAEAAAVLHRLVDKTARVPVPEPAETSDMWTDAEFEAFMKSAEVKDYVNTTDIVKVEKGQIYFRSSNDSDGYEVIPDDKYPGMSKQVYNLFKIMAYHTKKTDGYMAGFYQSRNEPKYVEMQFFVNKTDPKYLLYGAIDLTVYIEPIKSLTAEKYFPSRQKGDTYYEWSIGVIREKDAIKDYKPGMDRSRFEWTSPRYERMILDLSKEIYGLHQGEAFFEFALKYVDAYFLSDDKNYKSSYFGYNKDVGVEIIHYYPEEYNYGLKFSTDKPEVRK